MGLVGLHIAQKTEQFPEWVWSTFEQVDNVPGDAGGSGSYSFNNGTDNPPASDGYDNRPAALTPVAKADRTPVQVTRYNKIPTTPAGSSTVDLNKYYQTLLAGTVWQHYELVFTQWPTDAKSFTLADYGGVYPKDSGQPFPVKAVTNSTIETYFQAAGPSSLGNSCMSCHYNGAASYDFSWVLKRRAH